MRKFKILVACLLMLTLILPYQVGYTAENNINLLFVNDDFSRVDLLQEVKKEFGITPNFINQIKTEVKTKQQTLNLPKYDKYDVIAFPVDMIDDNLKAKIRELVKNGKTIYVYNNNLSVETAQSIFDEKIVNVRKNQTYQVIGVKKDGELNVLLGDYKIEGNVEESFLSDPMRPFSLILSSIAGNLLREYSLTVSKKSADAAGTRVKTKTDITDNYYDSSTLCIVSNLDYSIWRESDSDPNNDYFALETSYELTPYNGTIYRQQIKHSQINTNHQINNWSPGSSSNSSWSVSLPWSITWNFNSILSLSNTTSGSQTNDWANWALSRSGQWINSMTRFVPGSAWTVTNPTGYFAINSRLSLELYTPSNHYLYPYFDLACTYTY